MATMAVAQEPLALKVIPYSIYNKMNGSSIYV